MNDDIEILFFELYNDIDNELLSYIDNKRIREYQTPLIVDNTYNEESLRLFLKYPNRFTVIDGKKMHLDKCFRKEPLLPILEEARRLLVLAMMNNRTLVIRLGDSATDFLHTFNDDKAGATLGIIERDVTAYENYLDNIVDTNDSKIDELVKFKNKVIDNNQDHKQIEMKENINDDASDKSSDWRSYDYNYDDKSDSTFVPPWDINNSTTVSNRDITEDLIENNSVSNHSNTTTHTDSHHHHERNKADARVEGGPGSFGSSEGLGLFNPRPPYKPYSYFPKRVLINGGLKLNNDFWKDRLYRREDLGYGQGNIHHTLFIEDNTNTKRFNVIITTTHEVDSLPSFLFNGRFGLPSIDNFKIHILSNRIDDKIVNNNDI